MNQFLVVVLLALVAGGSCGKPSGGPGQPASPPGKPAGPPGSPGKPTGPPGKPAGPPGKPAGPPGKPAGLIQKVLCNKAFTPSAAEAEKWWNATDTCVAAQPGLEAIIAGLELHSGESSEEGFFSSDRIHDVASVLEAHGYSANATELRNCTATEMGMVTSDGTYDMAALEASIQGKVAGQSIGANTQLGLDNCPDVVEFDEFEYLHCVWTYCLTGAAPL